MLIETHNRLAEKLREIDKSRIEAEKEAKRPAGRKWEPKINSSTLSYFESRGQLLELHRWSSYSDSLPRRMVAAWLSRMPCS